jgi:cytochrome c oxidase assembly factor CtaG
VTAAEIASDPPGAGGRRWRARERHWLSGVALALLVACLAPPAATLARRYVFVESIEFGLFAMVVPGLLAAGAPWRLLRLSRAGPAGIPPDAPGPGGPADRLALARRRHPSFVRSVVFLVVFAGACGFWRLPPVVDTLARNQALVAAEVASLLAAGTGLWLEIVPSPPLAPRGRGPQRALIAALAMWFIWITSYILGFANGVVFHAYQRASGGLGAVTDQELATLLMWLVAGLCFAPVIFIIMLGWLRDSEDTDAELARVADEVGLPAVKGWGRPRRRKTSHA